MTQRPIYDVTKLKVIVIEDHPQMRKAIARILEKMNIETVLEESSGLQAVETIFATNIDLIICDLHVKDMTGFEIISRIRSRDVASDIPILIVTGEASKDDIIKASDCGADDYLLKPFQAEDLKAKIQKLLTQYNSPTPIIKLIRKAERLFLEKQYDNAVVAAEEALQMDPKSVRCRHIKGITLYKLKQTDNAIRLLNENVELNEDYYKTYASLAEIYLEQKNIPAAIEQMQKELLYHPKQLHRQMQIATLLLNAGRLDEAQDHFRYILQQDVRHKSALFGMGKAYGAAGNLEKAVYYFKRVRRYHPDTTKALEAIVKLCLDHDDPKRAEHALKDEKKVNKNRLDTYIVLTKFYLAMNKKDEALETLKELITKEPENTDGLKLKASLHLNYQEYPQAIETFEALLQKEDNVVNNLSYCDALISGKQYDEAILILHKCFRFNQKGFEIFSRLAHCYEITGQFGKAFLVNTKLQQKVSNNPVIARNAQKCRTLLEQRRGIKPRKIAS